MIASASITLTNLADGLSTFYQYAKNTSDTTPPTTGWSTAMPSRTSGEFIWRREASALSLDDVTAWENTVCLTGATGASGPKGDTGEQGPPGNPGAVGVNPNENLIQVAGFEEDGSFGASTGIIYNGSTPISINNAEYTVNEDGKGYIFTNSSGNLSFGRIHYRSIGFVPTPRKNILSNDFLTPKPTFSGANFDPATHTWTGSVESGADLTWGAGLIVSAGQNIRVPFGKTYIVSLEIYASAAVTFKADVNNFPVGVDAWSGNDNDNSDARGLFSETIPANTWTKVWFSYENSSIDNTSKVDLYDGSNFGVANQSGSTITVKYRNIKGEIGTEYSSFEPAFNESTINESLKVAFVDFNTYEEIFPDLVIGSFQVNDGIVDNAEMLPARNVNDFLNSNMLEILNKGDKEDIKVMAMALGADRVFQTIVAITAFIQDLYVNNVKSKDYIEDSKSFPEEGFWLDGLNNIAKIAYLKAKNADIQGTFRNDGFKTLEPVDGTTITRYTTPKSIFKFSDAYNLFPDSNSLQSISGTFEGNSFTQATRRSSTRILLYKDSSSSSTSVSAGDDKLLKRHVPSQVFGKNYYVRWHISYDGTNTHRSFIRNKAGQTVGQIYADHNARETIQTGEDSDGDPVYSVIFLYRGDMELWHSLGGAGTYSGTYSITDTYQEFSVIAYSGALWGSKTATSNLLEISTSRTFNSAVLVNGSTFREVSDQPDKYYLSSSKTFNIGGTTQDSASMKKYVSGTDFYNRFSTLPVGSIGDVSSGSINYNGSSYTVNRIQKTSNSIVLWSGSHQIVVNKFQNGTNTGVYSHLEVVSDIVFGKIDGGIETMHILPFDGANNTYDIGQSSKRFRAGYFYNVVSSSFNASSLRNLKKDISKYKGSALDVLNQVEVVNYRYKSENDEYLHTGLIADDSPECLTGKNHDVMSLSDTTGMLIKAVQELDEKIHKLEGR
ncbi:tail fiber domain-containing protein [uncultured Sphaerochaeta sp.]|uniref:tail fiber domain-containing protein n=1 Tax=uncultured Sphaerochaeta sp. TaxID=886478 RepID=UPI0029CAA1AC|nr:tail fiber domain-containing protein [uncultured Sphaerochaeta sp.]